MGTDNWEAQTQNEKEQKLMMLDSQALEQIKIGNAFFGETVVLCTFTCTHIWNSMGFYHLVKKHVSNHY